MIGDIASRATLDRVDEILRTMGENCHNAAKEYYKQEKTQKLDEMLGATAVIEVLKMQINKLREDYEEEW